MILAQIRHWCAENGVQLADESPQDHDAQQELNSSRSSCKKRRRAQQDSSVDIDEASVSPAGNITPDECSPCQLQQLQQRPPPSSSSASTSIPPHSRCRGVSWDSKNSKWRAVLHRGGKHRFLGYFDSEGEAARTWDEAIKLHCAEHGLTLDQRRGLNFAANNKDEAPSAAEDMTEDETDDGVLYTAAPTNSHITLNACAPHQPQLQRPPLLASCATTSTGPRSRYRGLKWHSQRSKWEARLRMQRGGKTKYLGSFSSEEEAARAWDEALTLYCAEHGLPLDQQHLNFSPNDEDLGVICTAPLLHTSQQHHRKRGLQLDHPDEHAQRLHSSTNNSTHRLEVQHDDTAVTTEQESRRPTSAHFAVNARAAPHQPRLQRLPPLAPSASMTTAPRSRYRGVSWHSQKSKWQAQLQRGGKSKYLGYFGSEEEAARAWDEALTLYCAEHGLPLDECDLNFGTSAQLPLPPSSRYRGVSWNSQRSKWEARLQRGGKNKYLGYFGSEEEAARAWDEALTLYCTEHGLPLGEHQLNFSPSNEDPDAAEDDAANVLIHLLSPLHTSQQQQRQHILQRNQLSKDAQHLHPSADNSTHQLEVQHDDTVVTTEQESRRPTSAHFAVNARAAPHQPRLQRLPPLAPSASMTTAPRSRYRGVSWNSQSSKWEARLHRGGKNKYLYLGCFGSEEEAARARDEALKLHCAEHGLPLDERDLNFGARAQLPLPPSSRYRGVSWHSRKSKWRVELCRNGKTKHLGNFVSEEEAARAWDEALKLHCAEHGLPLDQRKLNVGPSAQLPLPQQSQHCGVSWHSHI